MMQTISDQNYFEHEADIGIIGIGDTVEAAFENGAAAMFAVMAELPGLHETNSIQVQFEEADLELAFPIWLNHLLTQARLHQLILCRFSLRKIGNTWVGQAWGQQWDSNIVRGTEVKGATLTMLSVKKIGQQWRAACVIDV